MTGKKITTQQQLDDLYDAIEFVNSWLKTNSTEKRELLCNALFSIDLRKKKLLPKNVLELDNQFDSISHYTPQLISAVYQVLRTPAYSQTYATIDINTNINTIQGFLESDWVEAWIAKKSEEDEQKRFHANIKKLRDKIEQPVTHHQHKRPISNADAMYQWEQGRWEQDLNEPTSTPQPPTIQPNNSVELSEAPISARPKPKTTNVDLNPTQERPRFVQLQLFENSAEKPSSKHSRD